MPITTPIPLTASPAVPTSGAPESTFDAMFEDFLAWQSTQLVSGINALAQAGFDNATSAQASASAAASSQALADTSANQATGASNFKGSWPGLSGALNKPASVEHQGRFWLLLNNLANVATSQPGVTADWLAFDVLLPVVPVTTASATAQAGRHYSLDYAGAVTLTLPASPALGAMVWVTVSNGRRDNVIARNGQTIMALAEDMTLNLVQSYQLRFLNNSWRIV